MEERQSKVRVPKVGEEIYISSSFPCSPNAFPHWIGGLAKVSRISELEGDPFVAVEELPVGGKGFNWRLLFPQQKNLREEFGDKRAHTISPVTGLP